MLMIIQGKWYPKESSQQYDSSLHIKENRFTLYVEGTLKYENELSTLTISNRLGNVQRKIRLEDGSVFSTDDNDGVDLLYNQRNTFKSIIHVFESRLSFVLISLLVILAFSFSFFKWGIPFISEKIAYSLPAKTNILISTNTMKILDEYIFKETKIPHDKQENIRNHVYKKFSILNEDKKLNYKIHFRLLKDGNKSLANAMALPSGDIILTDRFVELCENQDEMDSVILHEIGHVAKRHTLQMIIEGTFISVITMMVVGDTNALGDLGIGLGSLLISSNYSKHHESEADMYAFKKMLLFDIDPNSFSSIMQRITSDYQVSVSLNKEDTLMSYFSSHPTTKKRIEIANKYSECYKNSDYICE
ncbi:MAG: hypothetical protein COB42_05805 [Sulfurimonas sp.]|nr:MAG: hypothetical protein COB42_05805 [Sulfurimonas sp.]